MFEWTEETPSWRNDTETEETKRWNVEKRIGASSANSDGFMSLVMVPLLIVIPAIPVMQQAQLGRWYLIRPMISRRALQRLPDR